MVDILDSTATKITDATAMSVDDAKKKLRLSGKKAESFEKNVLERQDGQFNRLMSIIFGWKIQEDGSKKLISKMPNGKILFPDKSEDPDRIAPGIPYICLVYEPKENPDGSLARQAYAKIICEEDIPTIFIPSSRIPVMVWVAKDGRKHNKVPVGNSYGDRMMQLLNEAEKMKFSFIKVVFRINQG